MIMNIHQHDFSKLTNRCNQSRATASFSLEVPCRARALFGAPPRGDTGESCKKYQLWFLPITTQLSRPACIYSRVLTARAFITIG